jgi:hypothetical protein
MTDAKHHIRNCGMLSNFKAILNIETDSPYRGIAPIGYKRDWEK